MSRGEFPRAPQYRGDTGFLSYSHFDDELDGNALARLRDELTAEVRAQGGRPFAIFLDKEQIGDAPNWEEILKEALQQVDVLLPVVTPNYLTSHWCRREVQLFAAKESRLGGIRLMFPIHYIRTATLERPETDAIVRILRAHSWADWRPFRHDETSTDRRWALTELAASIADALEEQRRLLAPVFDEEARQLFNVGIDSAETDPQRALNALGELIFEHPESPLVYRMQASILRARAMAADGRPDDAITELDLFLRSIREAFLPGEPRDDPPMARMIDTNVLMAERLRAELIRGGPRRLS